ncbi:MAG: AraC family transcriptional regulator [Devosia sp.]|uniref:AraC family transcriptional regulator n=1 Tax=Devosia sp. TaxID=1871048 RepID=UPI0024CDA4F3|nr:AraC family transcriptional regulator [Devosia sp.]UYN98869.1 MAG: AraC family transcriptional regulator [Devosia sp.]
MTAIHHYQARMQRVLDHIDGHLDERLDLATLSAVAAFSPFHFHRQFSALFGISLNRYVQLTRLRHASGQLGMAETSITEIAMDAGYEAPDAFARAFRQRLGQSPSAFRNAPDWVEWLSAFGPLDTARSRLMHINFEPGDVTICDCPAVAVAMIEHRGDRSTIPQTREKFMAWRAANGRRPETSASYMVFRSEREPDDPAGYSMDLCVETEELVTPNPWQVKPGEIPAGRCAVLRFPGNSTNLEPAALYLYREWLPQSGEELRDFPVYCRRQLKTVPGMEAYEVVVDVFLPLK